MSNFQRIITHRPSNGEFCTAIACSIGVGVAMSPMLSHGRIGWWCLGVVVLPVLFLGIWIRVALALSDRDADASDWSVED